MNRCLGCGVKLQCSNSLAEGYVNDLNKKYCERCFKITHYNEYIYSDKDNKEFLKKIDYINNTGDLVILTVDFLNIIDFDKLKINNPVIVIFTKRDILPRSVYENKFLRKIKCNLNVLDMFFVSSKNNYNLDLLYEDILKFKRSNNVYVIGLTNAGKSSLINKMIKNYSNYDGDITVSNLPSTTLDFLEKKMGDITFIDTPGLLDLGNIIFKLDSDSIKKIIPSKEINPRIYQIKCPQSFVLEDFLRVDINDVNNVIFYISNSLNIKRYYKKIDNLSDFKCYKIDVLDNQDLVIKGLGFIKFKYRCHLNVYLVDGIELFVRDSIV